MSSINLAEPAYRYGCALVPYVLAAQRDAWVLSQALFPSAELSGPGLESENAKADRGIGQLNTTDKNAGFFLHNGVGGQDRINHVCMKRLQAGRHLVHANHGQIFRNFPSKVVPE